MANKKEVRSINIDTKEEHKGTTQEGEKVLGDEGVWESAQAETVADTKLDADTGHGDAVVIRVFEFGVEPGAFAHHMPTKQEIFNTHAKQIELMLWQDGLTRMDGFEPRLMINKKRTRYQIFITARPGLGQILADKPRTLSQLANG